jgi:hypothetical protein
MAEADPELSCMYPLRDWVTCIDACVYFYYKIRYNLKYMLNLLATNLDFCHDLLIHTNKKLNLIFKAFLKQKNRIYLFSNWLSLIIFVCSHCPLPSFILLFLI